MALFLVIEVNRIDDFFFTHLRDAPEGAANHVAGHNRRDLQAVPLTLERDLCQNAERIKIAKNQSEYLLVVLKLLHTLEHGIDVVQIEVLKLLNVMMGQVPVVQKHLTHFEDRHLQLVAVRQWDDLLMTEETCRCIDGAVQAAFADEMWQRAHVRNISIGEKHCVNKWQSLLECINVGWIKALVPAAVEQEMELIDLSNRVATLAKYLLIFSYLQQVAEWTIVHRTRDGFQLDDRRHISVAVTSWNSSHSILAVKFVLWQFCVSTQNSLETCNVTADHLRQNYGQSTV